MSNEPSALSGKNILIVEDEMLVSMLMEDILLDCGAVAVGPAAQLREALDLARTAEIDAALLDVNLGGARSFPVADILAERGIPFVFTSGYGEAALEAPHQGRPVLEKPFSPESIGAALAGCLNGSS